MDDPGPCLSIASAGVAVVLQRYRQSDCEQHPALKLLNARYYTGHKGVPCDRDTDFPRRCLKPCLLTCFQYDREDTMPDKRLRFTTTPQVEVSVFLIIFEFQWGA